MKFYKIGICAAALLSAAMLGGVNPANACGRDSDCLIGERSYRIVLPEGYEKIDDLGAIVYAHGHRGAAVKTIRNKALTKIADELGVAFIAANGVKGHWNLPHRPGASQFLRQDELAYFDSLKADLQERFGIAPDRIMMTGFSAGGMVTWHLACYRGNEFMGFAPMSGTFWEPVPDECPTGPVNLIHYHGTNDKVVPLDGRRIREAKQGNVFEALKLMTRIGGYKPAGHEELSDMECARKENNAGKRLEVCLYPSGHGFRAENIKRAWRIFNGERAHKG
ncbi:polyhydroxybutyrate depolymerase [Rhizobiales bacterium]|uniref:alpha/beta hydrolase family esterase n=1 Tax=Hongsoonwoonella zoysiae TaxID=2821844 RepID=UPI0015600A40|nr:alpha/beta hydrolase-fold protein [Hongsoonwoonella zoysiae]NRG18928.1 polyhydroxybutyrate depolymerase [Hongsoonwoonella zoysiae]